MSGDTSTGGMYKGVADASRMNNNMTKEGNVFAARRNAMKIAKVCFLCVFYVCAVVPVCFCT